MKRKPLTILAGDIGGTSARLALCRGSAAEFDLLAEQWFPCHEYGSLTEIIRQFRSRHGQPIDRACFGVAGTVQQHLVQSPNLPWPVRGDQIAAELGLPLVGLINDLVANLQGVATLGPEDLLTLNRGVPTPDGTIGVISAGTGLGEAVGYLQGDRYLPLPSEAGHADFAPRNELEAELLLHLRRTHGRVSYERVISGPGLQAIYRFLRDRALTMNPPGQSIAEMPDQQPATIASMALDGNCPICVEALELFVSCLGAEAGNLALRSLTRGGIYLGGGIAPKIIAKLRDPTFICAFLDKGRLRPLLETIPVQVILNDRTALLGAARTALLN